MGTFIQNILIGVRQWVNGKLEDLSFVVSSHINELTGRVNTLESGSTAMEAQISGITDSLSGKSDVGHTHQMADVSGLTAALDGKSSTAHTHTNAQISGVVIDDSTSSTTKTYSSSKILEMFGNISEFNVQVVSGLPESGESHTIYFVPCEDSGATNVKDEYMWIENRWEFIGTTQLDLSGYYTKEEVDTALSGKSDTGHTHTDKADKVTSATSGNFAGLDANGNLTDSGKKAADFAASAHTHAMSDVTGLEAALSGKSDTGHTHQMADVSGLTDALNSKSDTGHTHVIADVSGLTQELASKQDNLTAGDGIEISGTTISVASVTVAEVLEVLNDEEDE